MNPRATGISGLRSVAVFEAAKGVIVILAGFGLLSILQKDTQQVGESIVRHLHLNPAKHYPHVFIDAIARLDNSHLWLMACGAFAYSLVRFIEAYGLWHSRIWAEWFAISSGAIYIPFELIELARRATVLKVVLLVINVGIVTFVALLRFFEHRKKFR
jgi:uncharacterized membrane protein (DUF2068 family)